MAIVFLVGACTPWQNRGAGESVLKQWTRVEPPGPPELKPVELDPKKTALLILDIETLTTNMTRRPRAVASVPGIAKLLRQARQKGLPVLFSTTSRGTREDILPEVRPAGEEPVVKSSVDKFYNTDLDQMLRDRGVGSVVIVGTAAEGAVLHTATAAAIRAYHVIVPVDGLSSSTLYAEQYVCWHLVNAPGSRRRTTLTRLDLITIAD